MIESHTPFACQLTRLLSLELATAHSKDVPLKTRRPFGTWRRWPITKLKNRQGKKMRRPNNKYNNGKGLLPIEHLPAVDMWDI